MGAIWASKSVSRLMRLLHFNATYMPGRVALMLCPSIIADIGKPDQVVVVTGTNGKTTTSNLLAQALTRLGRRVLNNGLGSNTNAGIAAALISGVSLTGRPTYPLAVFEVDERSARLVLPGLKPTYLVCTNLTRDSIARNAHAEYIAWLLSSAIPDDTTLVLNADDLICAGLGKPDAPRVFFGVARQPGDGNTPSGSAIDLLACPQCGATLAWDFWRYNHIGQAHCPTCRFASPSPDYAVTQVDQATQRVTFDAAGQVINAHLLNDNIVNFYNQAAVVAVLDKLGVTPQQIATVFDHLAPPTSRFTLSQAGGVTIVRHLVKGSVAVACSRTFQYIMAMPGTKALVMNIDDMDDVRADCQNNCWLYETDYEYLNDPSLKQVVVGGVRCHDHALRLRLAGIDPSLIVTTTSERETADLVNLDGIERVFNLHSLHNSAATGNPVQARLVDRLESRTRGRGSLAENPESSAK